MIVLLDFSGHFNKIPSVAINIVNIAIGIEALVQCIKSDVIQESELEDLVLSPLFLATPLTLTLLIQPLPLS